MSADPRVSQWLVSQFGRPSGFWGSVAGSIMAHRASNRERARWTVELLQIRPEDRVLEVGFGPGVAIEHASRAAHRGSVVGVDHSEVMVEQATRRNARAIAEGRVELRLAAVEKLPELEAPPFDKIFAINSVGFWPDPVVQLEHLRELLVRGGTLALTVQPRGRGANEAAVERVAEKLADYLTRAGFVELRREIRPMKPVSAVAVLGRR
jgi:ubiquinone/menaquinone biosynthesis C-methylase UbiE